MAGGFYKYIAPDGANRGVHPGPHRVPVVFKVSSYGFFIPLVKRFGQGQAAKDAVI
jgi:hypothetical protein